MFLPFILSTELFFQGKQFSHYKEVYPTEIFLVCVRFSAGRGTALVVDVGEETTSVIPVHDGFVLRKGWFVFK